MRNPPPRCQSRVADGARLTDRPQGTGRPFGLRTPPAVELAASPMPNAGQKKSAGIEDGRWCALWFQAVKPGCGICRSGLMVRLDTSGCQSDFSAIDPKQTFARMLAEGWIGLRAHRSVRLCVSLLAGAAHPKIEPRQRYATSSCGLRARRIIGPVGSSNHRLINS